MSQLLDSTMEEGSVAGLQAFKFSGTKIESLGATEYTLATVAVDVTGTTAPFARELKEALIASVEACRKSPRANNLLLRVITFSTSLPGGIEEIHGFKPLDEIDSGDYPDFNPSGGTPLYDAIFSSLGATNSYAKRLMDQDFLANGIVFVITDGDDNSSTATLANIAKEVQRGVVSEEIESLIPILIGINAQMFGNRLQALEVDVGMQYKDAGDATSQNLAKLARFVSQSISTQSQALGTGGPSQNISATI